MDELREKVIKGLEMHVSGVCNQVTGDKKDFCPYWESDDNCMKELLSDALSLLKAQEPGWISVKDRLPDEQGTYLAFRKEPFGAVTIAWYSGPENGWLALDGSFYADGVVTHYMPLPEPPKEEERE